MRYELRFMPKAIRDLDAMSPDVARRIIAKTDMLTNDLAGDVKRLTQHTPEYRLRVGDYRVLLDIEANIITVYRVLHRSQAY